jgi:hypothetical protein
MDSTPRSATIADTSYGIDYNTEGANTNDGLGQYIIGTFTAIGTTQEINLTSVVPQLNAIQLRLISDSITTVGTYSTWAANYGLTGDDVLLTADSENGGVGDGYSSLAEFALGMDPTVSDARSRESFAIVDEDETSWFEYVYYRRTDYLEQGLSYEVMDFANLDSSDVQTDTQDEIVVGSDVDGYQKIINRYRIEDSARFIQLKIEQD